jgi:hypothetical protein
VIFKATCIAPGLDAPNTVEKDGYTFVETPAGDFVKVPEEYRAKCERLCGEVSASMQPIGLEGVFDAPLERLNGLWVPLKILEYVKKQNGHCAAT